MRRHLRSAKRSSASSSPPSRYHSRPDSYGFPVSKAIIGLTVLLLIPTVYLLLKVVGTLTDTNLLPQVVGGSDPNLAGHSSSHTNPLEDGLVSDGGGDVLLNHGDVGTAQRANWRVRNGANDGGGMKRPLVAENSDEVSGSVPLSPLMRGQQSAGSGQRVEDALRKEDSGQLVAKAKSQLLEFESAVDSSMKKHKEAAANGYVAPVKSDEVDASKELPNEKYTLIEAKQSNRKIEYPSATSKDKCDWSVERQFNASIEILRRLKERNMFPRTDCPSFYREFGWRPGTGYVPAVFGDYCEPWWNRDAVYLVSRLLQPHMKSVEYGSGISSVWIALHSGFLVAVESNGGWAKGVRNVSRALGIENIDVRQFGLGRKYVELEFGAATDGSTPGGLDWSLETGGGVDFVSVDGRLRKPCLDYILPRMKTHGGIVLFDNSDRPDDAEDPVHWDGERALTVVPKHWLRYDSYVLQKHKEKLNTERWLQNGRTTVFITRDKNCI